MTIRLVPVAVLLGLLTFGETHSGLSNDPPESIGKRIANFTLKDAVKNTTVSLDDFKDRKAVVVVFMGTECPINNAYQPRLAQLNKEYTAKGVQFLAVYSNEQDTAETVSAHAKKHDLTFPALKDDGSRIADFFGAQRNPEVCLLDAERILRYRGRIDDQMGFGFNRGKPTRRDLGEAIDEVLAGKPVSVATTEVPGCLIARAVTPKTGGSITYSNQVVRILQQNCQECHRPGQIGPFSLSTYNQAVAWSSNIREAVTENRMPPWHADPNHGRFSNDRSLNQEARETLLAWIENGCPKGDDKDLPPRRSFASDWRIGAPDAILTMEQTYDVPEEAPKTGIPYQYFTIETNFDEDKWVERAEARPGRRKSCTTLLPSSFRRA